MKKLKIFIYSILPPPNWRIPVIISLGVFTGLVILIFHISNASSYISDNPNACINCHVMIPQFTNWEKSSHARVATCNDCHVPHDNFIRKYFFKASDGARHSFMFTFRLEPQVIQIKDAGINVVQENCVRCHSNMIHDTKLISAGNKDPHTDERTLCWDCHREVPHGSVKGLSSTPYARVPGLNPLIPEWMDRYFESRKDTLNKN
jgi:cytochrome c nitrite reductase small subunit